MSELEKTPEVLTERAEAIWKDLAPAIEDAELDVDRVDLALYVQAIADFFDMANDLESDGLVLTDESGELRLNPMIEVERWLSARAMKLARELGFTPAARARRGGR